jgi:hypothetical protein
VAKKKDLKSIVEDGIKSVLESQGEPSDGRIKALALGIKMCALNAKLEESDYGDFFNPADDGSAGSVPAQGKRAANRRKKFSDGDDPEPDLAA